MGTLAPRRRSTTVTALVVTIPVALFVGWLTLAPERVEIRLPALYAQVSEAVGRLIGADWPTLLSLDFAANTIMFAAVGVLAYLILPRRAWLLALVAAPLACAASEFAQARFLPDRVPDLLDIAAASLGGAIGVVLASLCTLVVAWRRSAPSDRSPAVDLASPR